MAIGAGITGIVVLMTYLLTHNDEEPAAEEEEG
jgi:hypothetical protein